MKLLSQIGPEGLQCVLQILEMSSDLRLLARVLFSSKCRNFPSAFLRGAVSSTTVVSSIAMMSRLQGKGGHHPLIIQTGGHIAPHHRGLGKGI